MKTSDHHVGDTVELVSPLLFGHGVGRRGTVVAVRTDGQLSVDFDQTPYPPMTVTSPSEDFNLVKSAQAWTVAKVQHDENADVGPHILGDWIHRASGQSDVEHTRQYAAQLLAAADELERRRAAGGSRG